MMLSFSNGSRLPLPSSLMEKLPTHSRKPAHRWQVLHGSRRVYTGKAFRTALHPSPDLQGFGPCEENLPLE